MKAQNRPRHIKKQLPKADKIRSQEKGMGANRDLHSVKAKPPGGTGTSVPSIAGLMERYPEVQLATLVDAVPRGRELGSRDQIRWIPASRISGGSKPLRLITRNGKDWTGSFPSLAAALSRLAADNAVLDMEAVVLDSHGKSSFQSLQNALGEGGDRQSIVAYVFDLLYLNGKDLTKLPLVERKEKLQALLGKSNTLRYSGHVIGQGEEMFAKACEAGLEGIISKQANAPYVTGRSRSWLKIKCSLRQEFIIVGYSDPRRRASLGRALSWLPERWRPSRMREKSVPDSR